MFVRMIVSLVRFALWLGVAGTLVDATRLMLRKADQAHSVGLISLHELNQSLVGPGR